MATVNGLGNMLNANYLLGVNGQRQDSIARLWNSYGSFQTNAQQSAAGLAEVNANVKSVIAAYEDAKNAFNSEFDETMGDLGKSAAEIKDYNFSVKSEGAISTVTETADDGKVTTSTRYSDELKAALDTVKDFVNDYNSAVKFFSDNRAVSKRMEMLGNAFGDTTYRAASYAAIGLTTNSDGSITINEEKLAQAIVNDPGKVLTVLGAEGLAGKAESHISYANSQREQLFPAAEKMLGDELSAAALYTGNALGNVSAINNVGNLLNMMF